VSSVYVFTALLALAFLSDFSDVCDADLSSSLKKGDLVMSFTLYLSAASSLLPFYCFFSLQEFI
jgi:hypothetical protein